MTRNWWAINMIGWMMPNAHLKQRKNSGWNALQSARLDIFYILKYFGWAFLALRFDIWNFLVFQSLERLRSQRKHPSCSSGLANSSRKPSSFLSVHNTPAVALASSWDANVPFGLLLSFQTDRNKDVDPAPACASPLLAIPHQSVDQDSMAVGDTS